MATNLQQNKADAIDVEKEVVTTDVGLPKIDSRTRDLLFMSQLDATIKDPRQKLKLIAEACMNGDLSMGTMSFALVDLFPFDPAGRYKVETKIREGYAARHPSLSDFEEDNG